MAITLIAVGFVGHCRSGSLVRHAGRTPARCRPTSARASACSAARPSRRLVPPRVLDDEQRRRRRRAAPPRRARSTSAAAPYGGSRKMMSNADARQAADRARKPSADNSIAVARRRSARRFASMSATARGSRSTNVTCAAPRLSASMPDRAGPGIPVEHARAPRSRGARTLNSVSRSRRTSAAARPSRAPRDVGPFSSPAMMRIGRSIGSADRLQRPALAGQSSSSRSDSRAALAFAAQRRLASSGRHPDSRCRPMTCCTAAAATSSLTSDDAAS